MEVVKDDWYRGRYAKDDAKTWFKVMPKSDLNHFFLGFVIIRTKKTDCRLVHGLINRSTVSL